MEFSIATLLANFTDDKLVAAKVLEKKLGCQDGISLRKLHIALEVLQKIGVLVKDRGKYRRVTEEHVIEAKLRCSSKGFCFAIQEAEGLEDIYIRESNLSTAWNGDRVLVKVTKEASRRRSPEGEVRVILERSNQSLLARLKQTNTGFRAIPLDDRLLFELELQPNEIDLAQAIDHLVHVEIQRYPLGQYPPLGRVVQILGSDAEAAADIDLVCCKHDLPRTFSASVLEAVKGLPNQLESLELRQRLDLRHLLTITIENENRGVSGDGSSSSLLVENAFTLQKTVTGNWQIGFHITDVTHYIELDSSLDRDCLKRGRCVYLGETVLPMLPEALEERCSLLPGSERLAISVLLTLDAITGQLVEFEIQPTVIQIDHQLSAQEAIAIIRTEEEVAAIPDPILPLELGSPPQELPAPVIELLKQLSVLASAVKEYRMQRGDFELKLPQGQYPYYDEGLLGAVVVAKSSVELMLTELVLLVNQVVATHLKALGVPAIYRVQPAPDPEEVAEMIKLASHLGVELRLEQEEIVQPSDFKNCTEQFAQTQAIEQVLTYLLRDTLKPAHYSATLGSHFGLALEQGYTHYNSPLRRYPDLLIQRILEIVFEQGRDRRTTRAKEHVNLRHSSCHGQINWNVLPPEVHQELETDLARVIGQLNDREKEVQDAEADLAGLQKAQLMKERIGEVFQGLITGVQSYGFFVEIEVASPSGKLLQVEGLVHVSSLKDDWYEYRARQQALLGRKNRASYRLGDRVSVQVKSVDYYRQQIDLVTVNGDAESGTLSRNQHQTISEETETNPPSIDDELLPDPESYSDEE